MAHDQADAGWTCLDLPYHDDIAWSVEPWATSMKRRNERTLQDTLLGGITLLSVPPAAGRLF